MPFPGMLFGPFQDPRFEAMEAFSDSAEAEITAFDGKLTMESPEVGATLMQLSGPTATAILSRSLSRCALSHYVFQDLEGCRRRIVLQPLKRAL